jgi:hypothetical protein
VVNAATRKKLRRQLPSRPALLPPAVAATLTTHHLDDLVRMTGSDASTAYWWMSAGVVASSVCVYALVCFVSMYSTCRMIHISNAAAVSEREILRYTRVCTGRLRGIFHKISQQGGDDHTWICNESTTCRCFVSHAARETVHQSC